MAESTTTALNAESQLMLDQHLLRFPNELNKKSLRTARAALEKFQSETTAAIQTAAQNSLQAPHDASLSLASLDALIAKATTLKRKLETLHEEESALHERQGARIRHLATLDEIPSMVDVKFDWWTRTRLDRMLVDYLLRTGCPQSAIKLAKDKGIENLVDIDAFLAAGLVEQSLRNQRTQEALAWCTDNKRALKDIDSNLEMELRLQQFIEMTRAGDPAKLVDAALHARKYLSAQQDTDYGLRAWGLLAYPATTRAERYSSLYSRQRWHDLAREFIVTHNRIFGLPQKPLLHIALSAGLSSLKTPSCHSKIQSSSSNASSSMTSVCPICSTELNELSRKLPYAHHSKSSVENEPVVLPNGRIYGRERLMVMNEKIGTAEGKVRDPTDPTQEYDIRRVKKVFIS